MLYAALQGLALFSGLVLLLILAMELQNLAFDLPRLSPGSALAQLGRQLPVYALSYLVPLPLVVAALNLAPTEGFVHILWLVGAALTYALLAHLLGHGPATVPENLVFAGSITAIHEFRGRAMRTADRLTRQQINSASLETELRMARLQTLRAQIEPHFLFNTLANIRRLAQEAPSSAADILEHLIRYLEEALPRLNDGASTLAQERTLIDAYLRIYHLRMGSRLSYAIDIPATVERLKVPSAMLLTLIENAIKHGIHPLPQGGHIEVSARRAPNGQLELRVEDSGRGMMTHSGSGTGLANIRTRLNLLYGEAARLTLTTRSPHGVLARIQLPAEALT